MGMTSLPQKKYNIIYADPPWQFNNKKTGGSTKSGASQHYNTTAIHELCSIPVQDITADNCCLFMWWVGAMPSEALELVNAWGFKIKNMTMFVWNKTTKTGKPHFGMGYWTRAGAECCLMATKGNPKPISHNVRSVITASTGRHSAKPVEVADAIENLCGDLSRIELFARDHKPGWDAWGDQI